jgi:hypothetical protein
MGGRFSLNLLNITGSRASSRLTHLKLHRNTRPDGAVSLPRKSRKVKEHVIT